ncbi:MAG: hypothetical protein Q9227_002357 [Pyrenula ochraceoflavens]
MAQRNPGMSITLPRNFAFHSSDSSQPRTPNQTFDEIDLPPPAPHSTCRYRKPRFDHAVPPNSTLPSLFASDIPIPSIEVPQDTDTNMLSYMDRNTPSSPSQHVYLATSQRSPAPKTPPAQLQPPEPELNAASAWALERPTSSCSNMSDSSISSGETFTSRPSFGGSCTSPESDFQGSQKSRAMSSILDTPSRPSCSLSSHINFTPKTVWTKDMDNHLWNTYQMYLQDPKITPFKTVPGSLPPLGVCGRVAREAKRLWPKATKMSRPNSAREQLRDVFDDSHAVSSASPELPINKSGSSTPTAIFEEIPRPAWPKEAATRKRLKELCKRKFSIAPHYQRLLQSRSPSPFIDRSSRHGSVARSSSQTSSSLTRDLNVSLVASGATGVLAQLATEESPVGGAEDDWFNKTPVNSTKVDRVQERERGLGIEGTRLDSEIPRLGSPFMYNTWGPTRSKKREPRPALNSFDTIHATGPRLLSPATIDPFSNAHKRRAQYQLEDELSPGGSSVGQGIPDVVFSGDPQGNLSQRRVRLRNRGATLGAFSSLEGTDRFFSPTPSRPENRDVVPLFENTGLAPPPAEEQKRLGSPFEPDKVSSRRNRSPRHAPSLSDPFISSPFNTRAQESSSLGQRLAFSGESALAGAYQEPGNLSDADRIRQLLLNRHRK